MRLAEVADCFLHHDREIVRPIDDSVVRCIADRAVTIRAGRGIAPISLDTDSDARLIAVGGHQKVAVAVANGHQAVLGPHIGDLDTVASRQRFAEQTESLRQLYACRAEWVAHDSHPDFFTSQYEPARTRIAVQHHHAHVASAMLEHGWLGKTVLGIAFDGTGLGTDAAIWGGEILVASSTGFDRVGHLREFPLLGGETAIRDPSRVAIALLHDAFGSDAEQAMDRLGVLHRDRGLLAALLGNRGLSPITSSVGRLFDGVAVMTLDGVRCSYEGDPRCNWRPLAIPRTISPTRSRCRETTSRS